MIEDGSRPRRETVVPINKAANAVKGATTKAQPRRVLDPIGVVPKAQGMTDANVVMSDVFMKVLNELGKMNAVCGKYFKIAPPCRPTVEVARSPRDVKIEILAIATK